MARKAKTSAEKNAANRAVATAGRAKVRRSRKAETAVSLVSAAGLNEWLLGFCYDPKGGKSSKLRLNRDRFVALCKANGCWGEKWDSCTNGRLRMIGGIAIRRRLDAGEPFNVPPI
jgi:hypothetical protein